MGSASLEGRQASPGRQHPAPWGARCAAAPATGRGGAGGAGAAGHSTSRLIVSRLESEVVSPGRTPGGWAGPCTPDRHDEAGEARRSRPGPHARSCVVSAESASETARYVLTVYLSLQHEAALAR